MRYDWYPHRFADIKYGAFFTPPAGETPPIPFHNLRVDKKPMSDCFILSFPSSCLGTPIVPEAPASER